jgi:cell division transport system permease protein
MKNFHLFRRIVKSGFQNLLRNSWLTLAATAVMFVSLVIIQLALVLNITADGAAKELAKNLKAQIYFKDSTSDEQIGIISNDIRSIDIVDNIQFISGDEGKKELAASSPDSGDIQNAYSLLGGDIILPDSVRITVNDLSRMKEIETLANQPKYSGFVDTVSLGRVESQKTIDRASSAQRFISVGSIITASLLGFVSVLIIFNTIRMAIFTRREEIRIMKLIGATPNYIRGPFLIESALYGTFAGILSTAATYAVVFGLGKKISSQVEFASTYSFFTDIATIIGMLVAAVLLGIIVGLLSSMLAMEKHLKLKNW